MSPYKRINIDYDEKSTQQLCLEVDCELSCGGEYFEPQILENYIHDYIITIIIDQILQVENNSINLIYLVHTPLMLQMLLRMLCYYNKMELLINDIKKCTYMSLIIRITYYTIDYYCGWELGDTHDYQNEVIKRRLLQLMEKCLIILAENGQKIIGQTALKNSMSRLIIDIFASCRIELLEIIFSNNIKDFILNGIIGIDYSSDSDQYLTLCNIDGHSYLLELLAVDKYFEHNDIDTDFMDRYYVWLELVSSIWNWQKFFPVWFKAVKMKNMTILINNLMPYIQKFNIDNTKIICPQFYKQLWYIICTWGQVNDFHQLSKLDSLSGQHTPARVVDRMKKMNSYNKSCMERYL